MVGARGDQDCVRIAQDMLLFLVEDNLGLTPLDAEELINVRVYFLADLFARQQG
jgi:hypothetical protein